MPAATLVIASVLILMAVLLLRQAWLRREWTGLIVLLALLVWTGSAVVLASETGLELGIPRVLVLTAPIALITVAAGASWRARPLREAVVRVNPANGSDARTTVRLLLGLPFAAAAAAGVALVFVTVTPFDAHTRIVIAGLLLPIVWACGMVWAASARRLLAAVSIGLGCIVAGTVAGLLVFLGA